MYYNVLPLIYQNQITMQTLINKIASHTTETLIEVVKGLNNNFGENTNIVFDLALNELEVRMTEDKFIQLCNSL